MAAPTAEPPRPAQVRRLVGEAVDEMLGRAGVDPGVPRMRMRRAQHVGVTFVHQPDVVDVLAATAQEARILGARHRLTHRKLTHGSPLLGSWF